MSRAAVGGAARTAQGRRELEAQAQAALAARNHGVRSVAECAAALVRVAAATVEIDREAERKFNELGLDYTSAIADMRDLLTMVLVDADAIRVPADIAASPTRRLELMDRWG